MTVDFPSERQVNNVPFRSLGNIRFEEIKSGEKTLSYPEGGRLNVIIMNGSKEAVIKMDKVEEQIALSPYTLFIGGKDSRIRLSLPEEGKAIALYFSDVSSYCDSGFCEFLERNAADFSNSFSMCPMNDALKGYYTVMESAMGEMYDDLKFHEIMCREFFCLLFKCLAVSDAARFLCPSIPWHHDPVFRRKVMENYRHSYRVKSLMQDCGYSSKIFNRKFKAEFGVTPGKWIVEQVCKVIEERLSDPDMTFKSISRELHMSSVQSFSRFCTRNFGIPPGQLRERICHMKK